MGLLGASSEPPSAQSAPAPMNATTASERMLRPTSSAARLRVRASDECLPDDRPAEEERQRDGREQRDPCDENVLGLDENATDVPGVVGDARVATRNVPELEQEQRLGEERGAERDDRAREARRSAAEANGDDREDRRQKRGDEDRDQTRQCKRHVVGEPEA